MARVGDGWFPFGHNPRFPLDTLDRYKAGLETLQGLAEENGRDFRELQQAYVLIALGFGAGGCAAAHGVRRPRDGREPPPHVGID